MKILSILLFQIDGHTLKFSEINIIPDWLETPWALLTAILIGVIFYYRWRKNEYKNDYLARDKDLEGEKLKTKTLDEQVSELIPMIKSSEDLNIFIWANVIYKKFTEKHQEALGKALAKASMKDLVSSIKKGSPQEFFVKIAEITGLTEPENANHIHGGFLKEVWFQIYNNQTSELHKSLNKYLEKPCTGNKKASPLKIYSVMSVVTLEIEKIDFSRTAGAAEAGLASKLNQYKEDFLKKVKDYYYPLIEKAIEKYYADKKQMLVVDDCKFEEVYASYLVMHEKDERLSVYHKGLLQKSAERELEEHATNPKDEK